MTRFTVFTTALLALACLAPSALFAQKKINLKKQDYLVTVATTFGNIELLLWDAAPLHKANFAKLAQTGFYDSTAFHRVLDNFMIQGGDPNSKPGGNGELGAGGPGYNVPAEILEGKKHSRGMLAAARRGDAVNPQRESSGSQFYIVQAAKGAHHLDGQYSIFGEVMKGMEVVDKIAQQKVDRQGKPSTPIYMTVKVEILKRKNIEAMFEGEQYPELVKKKKN